MVTVRGELRLDILHQVMKEWIGGQLALQDELFLTEPDRPVRVELLDGSAVEYLGARAWVAGFGWKRVAGVPDQRCALSGF